MLSRRSLGLLGLALVLGITACADSAKKVRSPDEARALAATYRQPGASSGPRRPWEPVTRPAALSYCYSKQLNTPDGLMSLAKENCKGGTVLYYGQDVYVRQCPLLQMNRMTFICVPGEQASGAE